MATEEFITISEIVDYVITITGSVFEDLAEETVEMACNELNWFVPISDPFQMFWVVERSKRHALEKLLLTAATKFRVKQFFLQQKFENFFKMISKYDEDFKTAVDDNPELFDTAVGSSMIDYISSGFQRNEIGQDQTYLDYE